MAMIWGDLPWTHCGLRRRHDGLMAAAMLSEGLAELIALGRSSLANPDLPAHLRAGASLSPPDPATDFAGDWRDYIDYPTLAPASRALAIAGLALLHVAADLLAGR